jgi:hypothetical protein
MTKKHHLSMKLPSAALALRALMLIASPLVAVPSVWALPHQSALQAARQHEAIDSTGPFDPNVVQPFARSDQNSVSGPNRFTDQRGDEPR